MYNFLVGLISLLYAYELFPFIGILIPFLTLFIAFFFLKQKYSNGTMIKIYIVIFSALFIFLALEYDSFSQYFNLSFTYFLALNIGILILSTQNRLIQSLLLFSSITTPNIKIDESKTIQLYDSLIPSDYWIILTCLILTMYYIHCDGKDFCNFNKNIFVALLCIWIPSILHFVNNKYLESRALALCFFSLYDSYQ